MPRGRKNPEPKNVSDIDLLTLRPHFEAMVAGLPSVGWNLTLIQIGRTIEALSAQYRAAIPDKKKAVLDRDVSDTLDLIYFATSATRGSLETIALLLADGSIAEDAALRASAAEMVVNEHYRKQAAGRVVTTMDWLEKWSAERDAGRPLGTYAFDDLDSELLRQASKRTNLLEAADNVVGPEIRAVVREAAASGMLDTMARGRSAKENIDAHVRRLRRRIVRLKAPKDAAGNF